MSRTRLLRRQHDSAMDIVNEMKGELSEARPDASRLAILLAKLTGLLRIHLAQEDLTLYPYMIRSKNAAASAMGSRFQSEMGGLGQQFASYSERWSSSRLIAGSLEIFRAESQSIFGALDNRIERENNELYPQADAISSDEISRTA